jgi:hypothetical protein
VDLSASCSDSFWPGALLGTADEASGPFWPCPTTSLAVRWIRRPSFITVQRSRLRDAQRGARLAMWAAYHVDWSSTTYGKPGNCSGDEGGERPPQCSQRTDGDPAGGGSLNGALVRSVRFPARIVPWPFRRAWSQVRLVCALRRRRTESRHRLDTLGLGRNSGYPPRGPSPRMPRRWQA